MRPSDTIEEALVTVAGCPIMASTLNNAAYVRGTQRPVFSGLCALL